MTQAAPGHVQEVRRLVFDPLTKTQARQLRQIGQRLIRAIDPDNNSPEQPPPRQPAAARRHARTGTPVTSILSQHA